MWQIRGFCQVFIYLVILGKGIITCRRHTIYNSDLQIRAKMSSSGPPLNSLWTYRWVGTKTHPVVKLQIIFAGRTSKRKPLPCDLSWKTIYVSYKYKHWKKQEKQLQLKWISTKGSIVAKIYINLNKLSFSYLTHIMFKSN